MVLGLEDIDQLLADEEADELEYIHLTSNETLLSPRALKVLSSPLGNRYLLEHRDMRQDSPSRLNGFIFKGLSRVNAIEASAAEVCQELFGAKYVEFRCLSGLHAMQTTMLSLTEPGDTVMRFGIVDGGHFATEHLIKVFGRKSCTYGFDRARLTIDIAKTAEIFKREKPKLLYLDAMNYLFPFPIRELREVVGDTPILYDASHTLGLIAGGQFQNPLAEGADILQANTHKTLFGPQKGIILTNNRELIDRIGYNLSQGLVSSQHTASLLSLFIALHETRLTGRAFAKQVVENARTLAERLAAQGVPVLARHDGQFTDNHHFFINLTGVASAAHQLERLLRAHLVVQRGMPFRNVDALRVGVQEVTRRGYGPGEMAQLAEWMAAVLHGAEPEVLAPAVRAMARRFDQTYYTGEAGDGTLDLPAIPPPSAKGRWVDYRHLGNEFAMSDDQFADIRSLGAAAGDFPNQTDSTGNVSLRAGERVFVSSSGSYIKHLADGQVVELDAVDPSGELIDYHGAALPSSESLMHFLVYQSVPAGAVIHTHYLLTNQEAADFGVVVVPPQEYASIALARAVAEGSKRSRIVYIQKHGLVFWGTDTADCLAQVHNFIHNRPPRRAAEAAYAS